MTRVLFLRSHRCCGKIRTMSKTMATPVSYGSASVPVRDDLPAAHQRAWERLARPGNGQTGAEGVAMAAEIRNAWRFPAVRRAQCRALTVYRRG